MADFDLAASFIPSLHKPASLLPIARHRQSLLYLIETYPVTIVVGQTGSGKTTQIPQYLEQAGWCSEGKVIAVTQVDCNRIKAPSYVNIYSPVELQLLPLPSELQTKSDAKLVKRLDTPSALRTLPQQQHGSSFLLTACFCGKPSLTRCCLVTPSSWLMKLTSDP